MPKRLDRYEIRDKIGEGAMGEVFRAYDTQTERDVAIKMLSSSSLHGHRLERFKREARTIANLEHPSVVPLYDFHLTEGEEAPFLVMRYMTGSTLADKIRNGPLPTDEAYQILRRIGEALDAAHSRGLVHRDLKPGNILLDQDGYAYLADFGVVKDDTATESLTSDGQPGTVPYMSPEQIKGEDLDNRSDVYSLGVVVFEMLTGRLPFGGNLNTIVQGHIHEPVPSVFTIVDHLSVEIDEVLRKAMAKEPIERFRKASHLSRLLEAALQSPSAYISTWDALAKNIDDDSEFRPAFDPIKEMPDTAPSPTLPETVRTSETRRWQFLAAGLAAVLLIFFAWFGLTQFNQDRSDVVTNLTPELTATATEVVEVVPIPTIEIPEQTPIPDTILVLQAADSAIWQGGDEIERIPEDGRIPFQPPLLIQSNNEPVRLLLPNLVTIILDTNSWIWIEAAPLDEGITELKLERGRLFIESRGLPVHVYHESGYQAALITGSIGVVYDEGKDHWEVDCLEGMCQFGQGDQDEQIELEEGQFLVLSVSEGVTTPSPARYATYTNLANTIPTPSATPTFTPTQTPTATNTATVTPTPSPTEASDARGPETIVLGSSPGGNEISVTRLGNGPEVILLVGGIHSGYAPNSVLLADELITYFSQNLTAVPQSVTLYIINNLSPDASISPGTWEGRLNANGVDLNRNWDCRWIPDPAILTEDKVIGGGGTAVFSEPETQFLKAFIEQTQPEAVLFWGATRNVSRVLPGVCDSTSGVSVPFSQYYGQATGYDYFTKLEVNADDSLTGDVTNWLDSTGIPAIFVLLPGFLEIDFQRELSGVLAVMTAVAEPEKVQQTPTPVSCQTAVNSAWIALFAEHRFRLGCATAAPQRPFAVWQQFENGRMLWRDDTNQVIVLYNDATMVSFVVDDPSLDGFELSEELKGAIGFVWDSNPAVASKIGDPLQKEEEADNFLVQDFVDGAIFSLQDDTLQTIIIFTDLNQWQSP